jgi:four helix bundle protein
MIQEFKNSMIMSTIKSFEELDIWQKARMFSRNIIRITNNVKFSPDFRLIDQIRASSGSVMDNIAEGFERSGNKEFIQFLYIAKGSCGESRSQLYRALDSGYIQEDEFNTLKEEAIALSQNISNFIKYLHHSEMKGSKYNH